MRDYVRKNKIDEIMYCPRCENNTFSDPDKLGYMICDFCRLRIDPARKLNKKRSVNDFLDIMKEFKKHNRGTDNANNIMYSS